MRPSTRYPSVLIAVGLVLLPTVSPAEARQRVPSRSAAPAVVQGWDAGVSRNEATSFEIFGRPTTAKGTRRAGGDAAPAPMAPQPLSGFDGLQDPFSVPSDTTGARGDGFIVAAVNTQLAVYDLTGAQVVAPIQLDQLHPNTAGHFVFDPKVVYDQYNDTFVLVYLVQEDAPRLSLLVTVAIPNATADDPSSWCAVSFEGDQVPGAPVVWADYPGLGYNDTRVTITTNQFTFPSSTGSFRYSQVMTIDKEGLYDCGPSVTPFVFAGTQTRDDLGRQSFTLRPAETVGSSPGPQLLVSFESVQGKRDYVTVWRVKPTASGFALKKTLRRTGRVSEPPLGSQGGGGIDDRQFFWDAGDTRLINAFYDADRNELFTAHTVFRNLQPDTLTGAYPEAAVRWYEIDPAGRLADTVLARRGIVGAPEADLGWASVASDGSGSLFVTYSRASDPRNEFLSAWVATIPATSTAAIQSLLRAGSFTYNAIPGPERWGDYTAINRDPVSPQEIATFNQYAATTDQWQQFVSLVTDT